MLECEFVCFLVTLEVGKENKTHAKLKRGTTVIERHLFFTQQGLLQNVRFIFDTSMEDILLSRDCEVTKQGKSV